MCVHVPPAQVLPFMYTFPGNDPSKTAWVDSSVAQCPFTTRVLRSLPGIRTALFSRMGPSTILTAHQVGLRHPMRFCALCLVARTRVGAA